jgi:hypothetical protein
MNLKLTLFEIGMYIQIPIVWYLFRRYAGRVVTGEMIAGAMIGIFNEFATEPLWDYHLQITYYKDTPAGIILCWAVMFTIVTWVSEKIYCAVFRQKKIIPNDKRIFLADLASAAIIAFPIETLGIKTGIWTYRYDRLNWDWGAVPFFNMPWEALVGYCLLMLIGPSFVRMWEKPFEGTAVGK